MAEDTRKPSQTLEKKKKQKRERENKIAQSVSRVHHAIKVYSWTELKKLLYTYQTTCK